jgi:hypothetical protein
LLTSTGNPNPFENACLLYATKLRWIFGLAAVLTVMFKPLHVRAANPDAPNANVVLTIPHVSEAPRLEDFLDMRPNSKWEGKLAKVDNFIQRLPSDGQPISQKTEAYLGYDDKNFYCIFVAFDAEPGKVRGHKVPRDNTTGDDWTNVRLAVVSGRPVSSLA